MRKIIIAIICLLCLTQAYAQKRQIHGNDASKAAINWLQSRYKNAGTISVLAVDSVRGTHGYVLFEVKTSINQTVLMSGSRDCLPILGTYKGSCISDEELPCGLNFMLEYYKQQIDTSFVVSRSKASQYQQDWDMLLAGDIPSSTKRPSIAPLTKSKWGQRSKHVGYDEYNYLIECDDDCQHCIVGCVAVAMGQLVYYWKYPALDMARIEQFDWCNMVNSLELNAPDYEKNRYAISYLLKECGKFVDMEYGCDASRANTCDVADALKDKFDFHDHTDCFHRYAHDNLLVNDWEETILYCLDAGRPVIYSGKTDDGSGHSFICDGYDASSGMFHFNWGWYGYYSTDDDWFTLSNPHPGTHGSYHNNQKAIWYARPNSTQDICDVNIYLDVYYYANPLIRMYLSHNLPLPWQLYELVPHTATSLTSASSSTEPSWRTIPAGATAVYQAHEEVILQDGFEAEAGCEFEARIEPCALCDEAGNNMQGANLPEGMASVGDQPDTTGGTVAYAVGQPQELPSDALFPNPTDGPLTMSTDGMAQAVLVYTLSGNPVGGWRIVALTETSLSLDVSALAPGAYLLSVTTPAGTRTAKFIRR